MANNSVKTKAGELKILESNRSKTVFQIRKNKKYYALELKVLCVCNNIFTVTGSNLGRSVHSCGCYKRHKPKETRLTHGHTSNIMILNKSKRSMTATYSSWVSCKMGCITPHAKIYQAYGAKGIEICDEWLVFENFLRDMGVKPPNHRLNRKNKDGNFEPDNCEWVRIKKRKKVHGSRLFSEMKNEE
jgi:hypothetical protein